ncbi:MAG TPA: AgmX/PglI C-terminal domain-containing protein [Kofleriaceae bacterium]|jgi:hypothetical protein
MKQILILSVVLWAGVANALKVDASDVSTRVSSTDVLGAASPDVDAVFTVPAVRKPLDKCVGSGQLLGWIVFDRGRVQTVSVGGSSSRLLESCIENALRKAKIASTGRIVATLKIEPLPPPPSKEERALGGAGDKVHPSLRLSSAQGKLGGFSVAELDRVVATRRGMFSACYEKELHRLSELAGIVNVTFAIAGDGTVSAATVVSTTLNSESVERCVIRNLTRLQFPSRPAAPSVGYSFTFAPEK